MLKNEYEYNLANTREKEYKNTDYKIYDDIQEKSETFRIRSHEKLCQKNKYNSRILWEMLMLGFIALGLSLACLW